MTKITYASLKLKKNTEVKTFDFMDKTIEVLQYLPIQEKQDLVEITLQKSELEGFYNPILIDMYFHLHLVYLYTNLTFTDKQKEKEEEIYDILTSSGLLIEVIKNIPETEYQLLLDYMEDYLKDKIAFERTTFGSILKILEELPKKVEQSGELVKSFNPEEFKEVMNFVKAINNGNDIK